MTYQQGFVVPQAHIREATVKKIIVGGLG